MLKVKRVMRYDARHGQPYEDYEAVDSGRLAYIIRKEDKRIAQQQADERSHRCPKCRNYANLDGTCDFCG